VTYKLKRGREDQETDDKRKEEKQEEAPERGDRQQ
jgi:hypothetical protein